MLELLEELKDIEYGFPNDKNENILVKDSEYYDKNFYDFYYLQTPEELRKSKIGVCWDLVELEREECKKRNIKYSTYFICTYDGENLPSHTFLVYEENNKYCLFESSWNTYRGIHEYDTLLDLLRDVKKNFIASHDASGYTFIYEYDEPPYHIGCEDMYKFVEKGRLMKVNEPFYFYHVVPKSAILSPGIISLDYMYQHRMYDLFDSKVEKYIDRITGGWNTKYKGRSSLTREETIDGLKEFRGEYGSKYIYFFKYPLYKELGSKISNLLEHCDIYEVNINDEELQRRIEDIFYGYECSDSDSRVLDEHYYENISKEDYFKSYDDSIDMYFKNINHISIAFKDGYLPIEFIRKVM